MLARLDTDESVLRSYLSSDGTQILVEGASGSTAEGLLAAGRDAVAPAGLQPKPLDPTRAQAAWSQRENRDAWLPKAELWRLSWREAETFTDRLLVELEKEVGPKVRELRPILVESFFDGLRPRSGEGPNASAWLPGSKTSVRREAILAQAATVLTPGQTKALRVYLADRKTVRRVARGG